MSDSYRFTQVRCSPNSLSNGMLKRFSSHHWHARRYRFDHEDPSTDAESDTFAAVRDGGQLFTPGRLRQLLAKAWCVRRIRWDTGEPGVCIEAGPHGYWLLTPQAKKKVAQGEIRK